MNIVYVGELNLGDISLQRKMMLENLGHNLICVNNINKFEKYSARRFIYMLSYYSNFPLDINSVNNKIWELCQSRPIDLVWIDKGLNIYPWTLRKIKELLPQVPVINFNPDNPFGEKPHGWGWYKRCLPLYDYCFVPREVSVTDYLRAGAKRVQRFYWGFTPEVHQPMPVSAADRRELGGPVGFIGTFEAHRAGKIRALAESGLPVRIWGHGWEKWQGKVPHLKIEGRALVDKEFSQTICTFDINLCFLNKRNRDTLNTRCLAIPACGGFMLAERTPDLLKLFREGEEAEFFESEEEMIEKVKFYLKNDELRREIARAGRRRCLEGNYNNYHRLQGILKIIASHRLAKI